MDKLAGWVIRHRLIVALSWLAITIAGAAIESVSRTGRLVTSAAIILFLALASLSTAKDITVREIAAGMAAGVVLDAIVVRMLLVPALVSLLGDLNWWLPPRAARLLFIKPAETVGLPGHGKHQTTLPATWRGGGS